LISIEQQHRAAAIKLFKKNGGPMVRIVTAITVATFVLPLAALAEAPKKAATPSTMAAPLEGANSFTQTQARQRIADAGFTGIGAPPKLRKA
jgi:hypothetical protein